jgi:hypothetical protein
MGANDFEGSDGGPLPVSMKAPLPDWLGPDTPERREDLQLFVQMMSEPAFQEDASEPIDEDSPAVLKGLIVMYRKRAELAEAELDELKNIAPAHRRLVPVVTMQKIATAVVQSLLGDKAGNPEAWLVHVDVKPADLHSAIMKAFDAELG